MALRTFNDATGMEWRVWDVRPDVRERRTSRDRRSSAGPAPRVERRRGPDRRLRELGPPSRTVAGLAGGWLCFETGPAHAPLRCRLAPIPPGWDACSEAALRAYLERAGPARPAAHSA